MTFLDQFNLDSTAEYRLCERGLLNKYGKAGALDVVDDQGQLAPSDNTNAALAYTALAGLSSLLIPGYALLHALERGVSTYTVLTYADTEFGWDEVGWVPYGWNGRMAANATDGGPAAERPGWDEKTRQEKPLERPYTQDDFPTQRQERVWIPDKHGDDGAKLPGEKFIRYVDDMSIIRMREKLSLRII